MREGSPKLESVKELAHPGGQKLGRIFYIFVFVCGKVQVGVGFIELLVLTVDVEYVVLAHHVGQFGLLSRYVVSDLSLVDVFEFFVEALMVTRESIVN